MIRIVPTLLMPLMLFACSMEADNVYMSNRYQFATHESDTPTLAVPVMTPYSDRQGGFETVIPSNWRRARDSEYRTGYMQVTFESPPSNSRDLFSDYLMIEILPGVSQPAFSHEPDERVAMTVDGSAVYRERFILDDYPVEDVTLDLVAWQIVLATPHYTLGLYVIGESREDARLERILIELAHAFSFKRPPFRLSGLSNGFIGALDSPLAKARKGVNDWVSV